MGRDYIVAKGGGLVTNREREAKNLEIVRRIKEGDRGACEELVRLNWGLISSVANRYQDSHLHFEDFFQEGYIGLSQAIDHFREGTGATFATYARYWIDQQIRRAILNQGHMIRVPCYLYRKDGTFPQDGKYKSFCKNSGFAKRARTAQFFPIDPSDYFSEDRDDGNEAISDRVAEILMCLTQDEADVLRFRYIDEEDLKTISERFGRSRFWAYKTIKKAKSKARAARQATA